MPPSSDFLLPLDQLPDPLPIPPLPAGWAFNTTIRPPGSKSITNRALLLAALADGTSTLRGALVDADDAQVMIAALRKLGAVVDVDGDTVKVRRGRTLEIAPGETVHLDLHNAGTATRFLAAAAMLAPPGTSIVIDGDARMRQRPIAELVAALRSIGADVQHLGGAGFPPLRIAPPALGSAPPVATFGRTSSSQFISALLLVGPFLPNGIIVRLDHAITSASYVWMTLGLLEELGVRAIFDLTVPPRGEQPTFKLPSGGVRAFDYSIESDASGATYFMAAAALVAGACVRIEGLPSRSLQGDARFSITIDEFGCEVRDERIVVGSKAIWPVSADLSDMPDTAMTAAVLACFAEPMPDNPTATTTLRGLRTLRVKETDRLAALQTELTKLGATVEIIKHGDDEGLRITPPPPLPRPSALGPHPFPSPPTTTTAWRWPWPSSACACRAC